MRIHLRLSVVWRAVEHPSRAGGLDGGGDPCGEAGSLVIAERVAFDVLRIQSRRKLARQRRLSAAGAADHYDPFRNRPSGDRTRRHAHDGTSRAGERQGCRGEDELPGHRPRSAPWRQDRRAGRRAAGRLPALVL
jgi:hypothetical protein